MYAFRHNFETPEAISAKLNTHITYKSIGDVGVGYP